MDKQQFECFTLSPLDGRYAGIKDALSEYFSEYALVKYRVFVEIQWLKFLIENVESDVLSKFDKDNLGPVSYTHLYCDNKIKIIDGKAKVI